MASSRRINCTWPYLRFINQFRRAGKSHSSHSRSPSKPARAFVAGSGAGYIKIELKHIVFGYLASARHEYAVRLLHFLRISQNALTRMGQVARSEVGPGRALQGNSVSRSSSLTFSHKRGNVALLGIGTEGWAGEGEGGRAAAASGDGRKERRREVKGQGGGEVLKGAKRG